jgi:hypothetical protein
MSGEPLGRLSGRFWAISPPAADLTGEDGASPTATGEVQGESPFFSSFHLSLLESVALIIGRVTLSQAMAEKGRSSIDHYGVRFDAPPQCLGFGNADPAYVESSSAGLHMELE